MSTMLPRPWRRAAGTVQPRTPKTLTLRKKKSKEQPLTERHVKSCSLVGFWVDYNIPRLEGILTTHSPNRNSGAVILLSGGCGIRWHSMRTGIFANLGKAFLQILLLISEKTLSFEVKLWTVSLYSKMWEISVNCRNLAFTFFQEESFQISID